MVQSSELQNGGAGLTSVPEKAAKAAGLNIPQVWPSRMADVLDIVWRPKATPVHELERYMRCKDCSQVRGYPYKRSHLVALRPTKISASDPPSTWWPGER